MRATGRDFNRFNETAKQAIRWVSGGDDAWISDFFRADLGRESITYSWPEADENDELAVLSITIQLGDDLAETYGNAAKAFREKERNFREISARPDISDDGRSNLNYTADDLGMVAGFFDDALRCQCGVELAA